MRSVTIAALACVATLFVPSASLASAGSRQHIKGCNTHACDKRVLRKAHQRTVKRWKKVTAPYQGWLMSTGNCETRGYSYSASYRVNTGNGFFGRYQFDYKSWLAAGGTTKYAHLAEPVEQDYRAVVWLKRAGRGAWPVCG